jgi:hypothetical protein
VLRKQSERRGTDAHDGLGAESGGTTAGRAEHSSPTWVTYWRVRKRSGRLLVGVVSALLVGQLGPVVPSAEAAQPRRAGVQRQLRQRKDPAHTLRVEHQSIDGFCDRLAAVTQDLARRRLFGLRREAPLTMGRWLEFADAKELETALRERTIVRVAEVWTRDDGATAIAVTAGGPARDWDRFADYCFRADGVLARVKSPLGAASANNEGVERTHRRYFRAGGTALPAPAPHERAVRLVVEEHPAYRSLADLPFATLLSPANDAQARR